MLSLYLHLPFCAQVCSYCSFSIVANQSEETIQAYLQQLHKEIDHYGQHYPKAEIKSLYFGGGTPNLIGAKELIKLIEHCEQVFDCENVAELSFEFNPYPQEEILQLVQQLNHQYRKRPRVRYSFGIQSLDNGVLAQAGRPYTFPGMVNFLRALQPLKQENNILNFDFIAFGKFNQSRKGNPQLRTPSALSFFSDFVHAHFADSFSLYTLELFENQRWKKEKKADLISQGCFGTEDEIYEEFDVLKEVLLEAGYARYEISNFALAAKSSIHNRVYREMEEYLGLGLGASSLVQPPFVKGGRGDFVDEKQRTTETSPPSRSLCGTGSPYKGGLQRHTNTPYLPKYLAGERVDEDSVQELTEQDYLIEKFFLALRTDRGIQDISAFSTVLVEGWEKKVEEYAEQGFLSLRSSSQGEGFVLSDRGMDCYNWIITELLREV